MWRLSPQHQRCRGGRVVGWVGGRAPQEKPGRGDLPRRCRASPAPPRPARAAACCHRRRTGSPHPPAPGPRMHNTAALARLGPDPPIMLPQAPAPPHLVGVVVPWGQRCIQAGEGVCRQGGRGCVGRGRRSRRRERWLSARGRARVPACSHACAQAWHVQLAKVLRGVPAGWHGAHGTGGAARRTHASCMAHTCKLHGARMQPPTQRSVPG